MAPGKKPLGRIIRKIFLRHIWNGYTRHSMNLACLRAIMLLPFNAVVTIPAILFIFFGSGYRLATPATVAAGAVLFMAGFALAAWTIYLFSTIGKGTLAPWNPTKKLVVSGPYAHVRNPMLSGVLMMILGESAILLSWEIFAWFALFFAINTVYFMYCEEKGLKKRFGDEYSIYKKNVPRWIPRIRLWKG